MSQSDAAPAPVGATKAEAGAPPGGLFGARTVRLLLILGSRYVRSTQIALVPPEEQGFSLNVLGSGMNVIGTR